LASQASLALQTGHVLGASHQICFTWRPSCIWGVYGTGLHCVRGRPGRGWRGKRTYM